MKTLNCYLSVIFRKILDLRIFYICSTSQFSVNVVRQTLLNQNHLFLGKAVPLAITVLAMRLPMDLDWPMTVGWHLLAARIMPLVTLSR